MRTLGKLRHERQAAPARAVAPAVERRIVQSAERSVWRRRGQLVFGTLGALAVLWLVARIFFAVGRTAEGFVVARPTTVVAPAQVRVTKLLCAAGQYVERGQVLAFLEPLHDAERDVLVSRLQKSRVRLELVRGGAALDDVDISRRMDAVVEAQVELQRASSAERRAELEVAGLSRSREALAVALQQDKVRKQGTHAVLEEQLLEARARVDQAVATHEERRAEAAEKQKLADAGIVSGRDLETTNAAAEAAAQEVAARRATVLALEQARAAAGLDRDLEPERATAALAELDAAIATARATADLATKEATAWRSTFERRSAILPIQDVPAGELQALEVALLAAEVAEREAEIAAHDRRVGRVTIRAEYGGAIDRVHAVELGVLESGEPLLTYFDPHDSWVEAFVPPALGRIEVGDPVYLVPDDGGPEVTGKVASVGRILVAAPPMLAAGLTAPTDRYLSVRITTPGTNLAPNLRVRAVFPLGTL